MILSIHLLLFFCCGLSLAQIQNETELGSSDSCISQTEFAAMKKVVENLQKDSEDQTVAMKERLEVLEQKLKDSEDQTADLRRQASIRVIFSAATGGGGHIGPYNTDITLIYRSVKTNIGSGYSPHTGIFTAPVPGVYYFTFFYHAGGQHGTVLWLFKNSHVIVESGDQASRNDPTDNGGNAVFLQLWRGDQVYMRMRENTYVWGNNYHTTFSGFLVTPM